MKIKDVRNTIPRRDMTREEREARVWWRNLRRHNYKVLTRAFYTPEEKY